MTDDYVPDAGHLIWTDIDPTLGREQPGRRPALVVSPAAFALNTGFSILCPITSKVRPFPTSVVLPAGLPIVGEILLKPSAERRYPRPQDPLRRSGHTSGYSTESARQAQSTHFDLRS